MSRKGTRWSDLRREQRLRTSARRQDVVSGQRNGRLWQIGHMPAREYGRKARDAARQIRSVDPSTELIACGSSAPFMPTYLVWDRETLEECYPEVDGLSLHRYYGNTPEETEGDSARFLALNLDMDLQIQETIAVCDYVRGLLKSPKRLWLSFDEWNVWYRARGGDHTNGHGKFAPPLLEEIYNLEDALLVGGMVNTLLRQAERVKRLPRANHQRDRRARHEQGQCLASDALLSVRLGNPVCKGRRAGPAGRIRRIRNRASLQRAYVRQPDSVKAHAPYLDIAATLDSTQRPLWPAHAHRDLQKDREVEIRFEGTTPTKVLRAETITGPDLKAANSFESPRNVAGQVFETPDPAPR